MNNAIPIDWNKWMKTHHIKLKGENAEVNDVSKKVIPKKNEASRSLQNGVR